MRPQNVSNIVDITVFKVLKFCVPAPNKYSTWIKLTPFRLHHWCYKNKFESTFGTSPLHYWINFLTQLYLINDALVSR